jgi:hypothetical protein
MEKRAFPRYRVVEMDGFQGKISSPARDWTLVTFAQGGCGFYGIESSASADLHQRVYCEFAWNRVEQTGIQVQGRLVSAVELDINDKKVVYYGIEFVPAHQNLIEPLVKELEKVATPT